MTTIEIPTDTDAVRWQGGYELSGEPGSGYQDALNMIDSQIGNLKQRRAEIQALSVHLHDWNENGFCMTCGADGNA